MINKNVENMEKCPKFIGCSQNLCPLDSEVHLRTGGESAKCRWMRESKRVKIQNKEFISGGRVMPDTILNFVSESNLKWLNESSRKRYLKLKYRKSINF